MENNTNKRRIKRKVLVGTAAAGMITLGIVRPDLAIYSTIGIVWATPAIIMNKELAEFEEEKKNATLSLRLTNNTNNKRED